MLAARPPPVGAGSPDRAQGRADDGFAGRSWGAARRRPALASGSTQRGHSLRQGAAFAGQAHNVEAFDRAVEQVAAATRAVLDALVTSARPRERGTPRARAIPAYGAWCDAIKGLDAVVNSLNDATTNYSCAR
ncbi:MAG: DUF2277 family protein [Candidatus Eisenbacteria bacterium]